MHITTSAVGRDIVAAATKADAATAVGVGAGDSTVFAGITATGDLVAQGARCVFKSGYVAFESNWQYVNMSYSSDTAQPCGTVYVIDPAATSDTVNGAYVPGVIGVSNPTVRTVAASKYADGDIVMMSNSTANDGFYEVVSHAANVLTIHGVGTVTRHESWTGSQFIPGLNDGATITKVKVAVVSVKDSGQFVLGFGNTVPLSYQVVSNPQTYSERLADYPVVSSDDDGATIVFLPVAADLVATLPTLAGTLNGFKVTIKNGSAGVKLVTVKGNGAELIDGSNTYVMTTRMACTVVKGSTGWFIV